MHQLCASRRFLDVEIHWDLNDTFGTAKALEALGTIPESISLGISLGIECGSCHKPVNYVKSLAEQKGASGEWLHDDGSPNCSLPVQKDNARKASPVGDSERCALCGIAKIRWR